MPNPKSLAHRTASFLIDRPKTVLLFLGLIAAFSFYFAPKMKRAAGIDPYFRTDSTLRQTLAEVNEQFVSDNTVIVMYETDDVFSHRSLGQIRDLGEQIHQLQLGDKEDAPAIADDVISLATVWDVRSSDLHFKSELLVPDPIPTDRAELAALRKRALNNHVIRENLLSADSPAVAAMIVRLPNSFDERKRLKAVKQIGATVKKYEEGVDSVQFALAGKPVLDAEMMGLMRHDMAKYMPIVYLVLTGLLFLFMLRVLPTVVALLSAYLAMQFSYAAVAVTDGVFTATSTRGPVIVMTLTAAFLIHFFSEYGKRAKEAEAAGNFDHRQVMHRTIRKLLPAAVIAAVTTSAGFAVNAWTPIPALQSFAIGVAISIIGAFFITILAFPLGARWRKGQKLISNRGMAMSNATQGILSRIGELHVKRPWLMLSASLGVVAVLAAGIPNLGFGFDQLRNFAPEVPVRQATEFMEAHVGGSTEIIVAVSAEEEDRFLAPAELKKLEELETFFRDEIGAERVTSVANMTKHMHRAFLGNDPNEYRLPDSPQQVAQLYHLNSDLRLYNYITPRHDAVRMVARIPAGNTDELADRYAEVESYLAANFPASGGYTAHATGQQRTWVEMTNGIAGSLVRTLSLAFVVIFGLLILFFRSPSTGVMSILPNILPVITNLGIMGWFGIRLDTTTVISASVVIGIAVDDTVHFLQHYRDELQRGRSIADAVRSTLRFKGPAVLGTTIVMLCGFSIMLLSSFHLVWAFGIIVCTGVSAALFADLFLLPAMLVCSRSRLGVRTGSETSRTSTFDQLSSVLDNTLTENTSPGTL